MLNYTEKMKEAVYGAITGDALGVPFEFNERGTFTCTEMVGYGTYGKPEGTWSDDSSMLLGTCAALKKNNGEVNIHDIRENFLKWINESRFTPDNEVFDVGNATYKALKTGQPQESERSNGNGSLMRILPLAFTDCTDDEVRAVSAITHGHRISTDACVIYVNIIRECLKGKSVEEAVHSLCLEAPFERLNAVDTFSEEEISSSGYVVDTLYAAVWCVLTSKTFKECLLKAVNLGSDTDTTACVAGGLAAMKFDFSEIPSGWIGALRNRELIEECL